MRADGRPSYLAGVIEAPWRAGSLAMRSFRAVSEWQSTKQRRSGCRANLGRAEPCAARMAAGSATECELRGGAGGHGEAGESGPRCRQGPGKHESREQKSGARHGSEHASDRRREWRRAVAHAPAYGSQRSSSPLVMWHAAFLSPRRFKGSIESRGHGRRDREAAAALRMSVLCFEEQALADGGAPRWTCSSLRRGDRTCITVSRT